MDEAVSGCFLSVGLRLRKLLISCPHQPEMQQVGRPARCLCACSRRTVWEHLTVLLLCERLPKVAAVAPRARRPLHQFRSPTARSGRRHRTLFAHHGSRTLLIVQVVALPPSGTSHDIEAKCGGVPGQPSTCSTRQPCHPLWCHGSFPHARSLVHRAPTERGMQRPSATRGQGQPLAACSWLSARVRTESVRTLWTCYLRPTQRWPRETASGPTLLFTTCPKIEYLLAQHGKRIANSEEKVLPR